MKYYLFVDNFRGFSDTCIPIKDVNFLVGENSTGKTSILGLLKLLSGSGFFFPPGFDNEHVDFGGFSDLVSAHADDKSSFHVGFIWEESGARKKRAVVTGSLFTFEEERGLPKLAKCTFCRGGNKISLRLGKNISYREEECAPMTAEETIAHLRTLWLREHISNRDKYTKLLVPPGVSRGLPILLALSFIRDGAKRGRKNDEFTLTPPDVDFLPSLIWLAPIRTKPKRTYDQIAQEIFSPEGSHTPYLIRTILRTRSKSSALKLRNFIEKVGKASGLFQEVRIKNFGRGETVPFELDIVLDGKALNVTNVGYGVTQALPVLVEILARSNGSWFAIQQPEVHLHPRAQAALGDLFFELAVDDRKVFLIETHSDFTIDRFRINYRNARGVKPDSQILFFERCERQNKVTPLPIGETGELPSDQPDSYRRFFIREQMDILGL